MYTTSRDHMVTFDDRFQIRGPATSGQKKSFEIANLGVEIDELCVTDHKTVIHNIFTPCKTRQFYISIL